VYWGTTGRSHHQISTSQVQLQSIPASAGRRGWLRWQPTCENRFCLTWVVKNHSMVCSMTKTICDSYLNSWPQHPWGPPIEGLQPALPCTQPFGAQMGSMYPAFWSPDGVQNPPRQLTSAHATITTKSRNLPFRPSPPAPSTPRDLPYMPVIVSRSESESRSSCSDFPGPAKITAVTTSTGNLRCFETSSS
jgi:hypothetical protein